MTASIRIELPGGAVRAWRSDDSAALARHADNRKIWRNLRDAFPHPYGLEDAKRFLARAAAQEPPTFLAIASAQDEAIGSIGFTPHTDVERFSAEIGYWLAEPWWGAGIATAALRAVTEHAFTEHGLVRLYAMPYAWNRASARVLTKAGYRLEGRMQASAFKDGRFVDQLLFARVAVGAAR